MPEVQRSDAEDQHTGKLQGDDGDGEADPWTAAATHRLGADAPGSRASPIENLSQ